MSRILLFGSVLIAAGAVSAAAVPLAARLGWRWQGIDHPGPRKHHDGPVPRTGGIAVAAGILAGLLVASGLGLFSTFSTADGDPWNGAVVFAATALIFAVGLLDDLRGCSVGGKLVVQIAAAGMVVATGPSVAFVSLPFGGLIEFGPVMGSVVAVVWLVGITNAINFMDGLDGLAGGLAAIIAISLGVFAVIQGVPALFAVAAAVCGACVGFLPFNWRPARIFLGDSGSLTIGFVLGWIALAASLKSNAVVAILVPLLALGVPAIDALLVMLARFTERVPGRRMWQRIARVFQADRWHVHHHGLSVVRHHKAVVLLLYALVACFCLFALAATTRSTPTLAVATIIVEAAVVVAIRVAGVRVLKR